MYVQFQLTRTFWAVYEPGIKILDTLITPPDINKYYNHTEKLSTWGAIHGGSFLHWLLI